MTTQEAFQEAKAPLGRTSRRLRFGIVLVAAFVLMAPSGMAQDESTGDITLHETEDGPATHAASCEFWIRGANFSEQEVRLEAAHELDGPSAHQHHLANVTAEPAGNGTFAFLAGPFTLHETDDEWLILSVVHPEGEEFSDTTDGEELDYVACAPPAPSPTPPPFCEPTLQAEAQGDGSVRLHWEAPTDGAPLDHYDVVRDHEVIAEVTEPTFTDTTAEVGQTYTYQVDAVHVKPGGGETSLTCGEATVTAIPFFGAVGGLLAALTALGAYATLRRRA